MSGPTATELLITKLRYDVCDKLESCEPCKGLRQESIKALEQSRALVTELRALAERMRPSGEYVLPGYDEGCRDVSQYWQSELSSLLSAHDAQQAEGKGE